MITKNKLNSKILLLLLLPLLFIVIGLGYLYKERYLACITQNPLLCLQSKKYVSASGKFIFRYPTDYPLSFKTGDQLINEYRFDDKYDEWVDFSGEYYPNAGGESLGNIIVTKNIPYKDVKEYALKELNDFEIPTTIDYINVGGKAAVCSYLKQQPQSFTAPSYDCYILENRLLYSISFNYNDYYHKLPTEYYQSARQLILSTFKFN